MSIDLINFRELGGIKTNDKRQIKDHLFYRGPAFAMSRLSYEDKKEIDGIGFKHIVDLRGYDELARAGQLYIPSGCVYHHIPAITIENEIASDDLDTLARDGVSYEDAYMARIYRTLPFSNRAYKELFTLVKQDEVPFYFHCSAGKDRTGVFAALLELLLGVNEKEIIADYMKSSSIYKEYYEKVLKIEDIDEAWLCNVDWIIGSLKALLVRYKSYEDYFYFEFDIDKDDIEKIKGRYLKDL